MTLYDELVARGLIAQVTDEEEIKELINNGKAVFYIGFDPTADSLHVGHFMALCLMKRLQMAGNKPIALIGGGTAMIGDPSGRTDMRQMMTPETIQHNVDCFKKQMSRFIDFGEGKAMLVNNADWLMDLNYIDVLRDVGAHFSVNRMLTAECYKQRMEKGLSFLEFNYMIMQSYDFYTLYQKYGCNMEFGGDDQWSNMLGGTELIRRKLGKDAYAMTINLLLNSEGKKMGKTQSGAVWLDPNKTSPFDFFQYWRNVADSDVLKCIRMLTFLPKAPHGHGLDQPNDGVSPSIHKICIFSKFDCTSLDVICTIFSVSRSQNACAHSLIFCSIIAAPAFSCTGCCVLSTFSVVCSVFVSDGFWFVRQLTATSATKTVAIAATQVCGFLKFNTFLILLPASASPNATGANEYGCRSIAKASKDALYPFLI